MLSPVRLSSVTPYSAGRNFRQCFYAIWYLGHPFASTENVSEIVPGDPPARELNARGVTKYSNFWPIEAISRKRCKIGGKLVFITNRKLYDRSIGTKIGYPEWPWIAYGLCFALFHRICVRCRRKEFTFAISSPGEFLVRLWFCKVVWQHTG